MAQPCKTPDLFWPTFFAGGASDAAAIRSTQWVPPWVSFSFALHTAARVAMTGLHSLHTGPIRGQRGGNGQTNGTNEFTTAKQSVREVRGGESECLLGPSVAAPKTPPKKNLAPPFQGNFF